MTDVTTILNQIEHGDPVAAEQLLPLVYDELRKLAAARLAHEQPGQTLQATALVHEAYVRLVDQTSPQQWDGRGHFFSAAAESMRRILVERARRRKAEKYGGGMARVEVSDRDLLSRSDPEEILALNDALDVLAQDESEASELVKLRIFADFSVEEAGKLLGLSRATAYRHWTYARAWLKTQLARDADSGEDGKKSEKA
ncbi:ECF-type sigma factor [Stieleria sp. ICT_E10.1]|uniref:ECF-type sigma factor n=1 Tax=Stieleria sedimenti TaxID=2976331 RepID=UPI00217FA082|nr:ECF-type sigma factor [Stieleria sedimenti]MCS7471582.1 ECF-type sigma factor [Stieleria sedimenti]